jgi:hypothetical protein
MRILNEEHRGRRWRIDEVASDFELQDVWSMPATGIEQQFPEFVALLAPERPPESGSKAEKGSGPTRWLFSLRMWLGRVFKWDRDINRLPIPGCRETSVRERLPEAERVELPPPSDFPLTLRPVYQDQREAFFELSNDTVHALIQYSWVPEGTHHRARMAVYTKTRGGFGRAYLAVIAPFRRYVLYPVILRHIGAKWRAAGRP